jgi:hypothetical protein
MNKPFVPRGYIWLLDLKSDDLRHRLADGELQVVVPAPGGELIPILPKYWRDDTCQTWLDTGMFYDDMWKKYFPIWVKLIAPPAPPRGSKPTTFERVKREMFEYVQKHGLEALNAMTLDRMESAFNCRGRGTIIKAKKAVNEAYKNLDPTLTKR